MYWFNCLLKTRETTHQESWAFPLKGVDTGSRFAVDDWYKVQNINLELEAFGMQQLGIFINLNLGTKN